MSNYKHLTAGVCAAQGFSASGMASGLKKSGKLDLALIYSQVPASAAGVYTKNKIKAAPLILSKRHAASGYLQAVIINSGNANACTGARGMHNAKLMVKHSAAALAVDTKLVAVASTGVIGVQLAIEKIIKHIPPLTSVLAVDGSQAAAQAIMTTDTYAKEVAIEIELAGKKVVIGGMAKGSGMIHPNMATMLGFITTDAAITPQALQEALTAVTNASFNMISVDGDSSTNDMVLALANGLAANSLIESSAHPDWPAFCAALNYVATELAKQIAADGEGASKLIEVVVNGALSLKQARAVARGVAASTLVKAAVFGNDANWGRIACAAGYSDNKVKQNSLSIALGGLPLFANGLPLEFSEEQATLLLQQKTVVITLDLGLGHVSATAWGCDLSYDYVKINASYRS